jgi:hypothetical protein
MMVSQVAISKRSKLFDNIQYPFFLFYSHDATFKGLVMFPMDLFIFPDFSSQFNILIVNMQIENILNTHPVFHIVECVKTKVVYLVIEPGIHDKQRD